MDREQVQEILSTIREQAAQHTARRTRATAQAAQTQATLQLEAQLVRFSIQQNELAGHITQVEQALRELKNALTATRISAAKRGVSHRVRSSG
jgi:uncharacterized alpha-E superfamily protein